MSGTLNVLPGDGKSPEDVVETVSALVSLPEVYFKVRDLLQDVDSDIDDFSEIILTDANLTSLVLKVANSAFYGFGGRVKDIDRAVNLLGLSQLHDLVLAISAVNCIKSESELEALNVFWQRSIYCGVLSRLLSERCGIADPSSLFVAGLMHEIGRVVLFLKYPEQAKSAVIAAKAQHRPLYQVERKAFGYHYGELGSALLRSWNLPDKYYLPIEHQLDLAYLGEYSQQARILGLAHKISTNRFCGADTYDYDIDSTLLGIDADLLAQVLEEGEQMRRELETLILPNLR